MSATAFGFNSEADTVNGWEDDDARRVLGCDGCVVDYLRGVRRYNNRDARIKEKEEAMEQAHELALIALDPGGTTGWCVMVIGTEALLNPEMRILSSIALYTFGEIKGNEHEQLLEIENMLDAWPGAALVREDFILRTHSKAREVLSPVRLGFGIDHLLYLRGKGAFVQQPAMAKTTATDERLRAWGLYRPGSDHARDATRHAITFARRAKDNKKLLVSAWPHLKNQVAIR